MTKSLLLTQNEKVRGLLVDIDELTELLGFEDISVIVGGSYHYKNHELEYFWSVRSFHT